MVAVEVVEEVEVVGPEAADVVVEVGGRVEDESAVVEPLELLVEVPAEELEPGAGSDVVVGPGEDAGTPVDGRGWCTSPVPGSNWNMMRTASARTMITGSAPSATGRTLSWDRFNSSCIALGATCFRRDEEILASNL